MRVLSILASTLLLFFLGACSTTGENRRPDLRDFGAPGPERSYVDAVQHLSSVLGNIPGVKVSSETEIYVSWILIPGYSGGGGYSARLPVRKDCKISIADPGQIFARKYNCFGVSRIGNDFFVDFLEVGSDGIPRTLNLSKITRGKLIQGANYEKPFGQNWLTYGSISYQEVLVVWSTHNSIQ